jgi:hypothetical protein
MPGPSEGRASSSFATLALCLSLVGAAAMIYYHEGLFVPRVSVSRSAHHLDGGYSFGNDFYQIWLTARARLMKSSDPNSLSPYSEEMTQAIQVGLYGRLLDPNKPGDPKDRRTFPYPAFTDILCWPAAEISFPAARIVVLCLLVPLTVASAWLWLEALPHPEGRRVDWRWTTVAVLLLLSSYPALEGFYAVQIGLVVAFLLAASLLALVRGKLLLSGILMALTTIKPQVTVLVILYLLIWGAHDLRRRANFFIGLFITGFLLLASAMWVWPNWIGAWLHLLVAYRGYNPPPLLHVVLNALFGNAAGAVSLVLTAIFLLYAVFLAWSHRAATPGSLDFWLVLSFLLGLTVVAVLSGQAIYDHVILLPGILLLALHWRSLSPRPILKGLLAIDAAILVWPLIASCALIVARPLLTPQKFYSKAIFSLPLCLAIVFPFVILATLAVAIRSQKSRQPKVAADEAEDQPHLLLS